MNKANPFSSKMSQKSSDDLRQIIESNAHVPEAISAAKLELQSRESNGVLDREEEEKTRPLECEARYQDFVRDLDSNVHFGWTPRHEESINLNVPEGSFGAIVEEVANRLCWDLIQLDQNFALVKRRLDDSWTEDIMVESKGNGLWKIKSSTIGSQMLDMGRNSKRAKLFAHVIEEVIQEKGEEGLKQLTEQHNRRVNMDDYVVPDSLPNPPEYSHPNAMLLFGYSIMTILLFSAIFGLITQFLYIIMLFESLVALGVAYVLYDGMKRSNYFDHNQATMILVTIGIVIGSQYVQYLWILNKYNILDASFFDFIIARIDHGFHFRKINTGWVGWLVVYALQLLIIYFFGYFYLIKLILKYVSERVPVEVKEFAHYQVIKGKSEVGLEKELAKMGWSDPVHIQMVKDAIGAEYDAVEINT
ncbi:hypothetical protein [Reichenbachiella ulvae]|uniref:Uncharacterized protein n=1 Tax=Reichenbachiella ulvae TaxID=2980104 RepID=A0ABT3CZG3_9BACT|nr:hypothetical protein [Reichenbachiella ulvae]MCV9389088.1 hypothetical protein [Reichenbachiella ulvae]